MVTVLMEPKVREVRKRYLDELRVGRRERSGHPPQGVQVRFLIYMRRGLGCAGESGLSRTLR
jgi:hypothetical protein